MYTEAGQPPATYREIHLDLLRIIATFGVIVVHAAAAYWDSTPVKTFNWQVMNIYDSSFRWPIVIFVMISGAIHLQPHNIKDDFSIERRKLYQKIIRIICSIAFWTIVYHTFFPIVGCLFKAGNPIEIVIALKTALKKMVLGPGWYHLWYLYMIIGLYLSTPILVRFVANAQRKHIEYTIILFFIFGGCVQLYNTVNTLFDNVGLPTDDIYFPFPEFTGYIGYYIAGYYFSKYDLQKRTRILIYASAVVSLLFTILGCSLWSIYKNEPHGDLYGVILPNAMLVSFALFIFIKNISTWKLFEKIKDKAIFLSKMAFGISLLHDLFLQIFNKVGLNSLTFNPLFSIPLISLIIFIFGLIITILLKKIPLLKKYVT